MAEGAHAARGYRPVTSRTPSVRAEVALQPGTSASAHGHSTAPRPLLAANGLSVCLLQGDLTGASLAWLSPLGPFGPSQALPLLILNSSSISSAWQIIPFTFSPPLLFPFLPVSQTSFFLNCPHPVPQPGLWASGFHFPLFPCGSR